MLPSYRIASRLANIGILAAAAARAAGRRGAGARRPRCASNWRRFPMSLPKTAIQNMRAFREIKPLVLPWAS